MTLHSSTLKPAKRSAPLCINTRRRSLGRLPQALPSPSGRRQMDGDRRLRQRQVRLFCPALGRETGNECADSCSARTATRSESDVSPDSKTLTTYSTSIRRLASALRRGTGKLHAPRRRRPSDQARQRGLSPTAISGRRARRSVRRASGEERRIDKRAIGPHFDGGKTLVAAVDGPSTDGTRPPKDARRPRAGQRHRAVFVTPDGSRVAARRMATATSGMPRRRTRRFSAAYQRGALSPTAGSRLSCR